MPDLPDPARRELQLWRVLSADEWRRLLTETPCVHAALLLGVGCSAAMLAHKLALKRTTSSRLHTSALTRVSGSWRHSGLAAVATFSLTSCVQFSICAAEHDKKKALLREAFGKRNVREAPR